MLRTLVRTIAGLVIVIAPIAASAQTADDARASFDRLLVNESQSWVMYRYERGSVGTPVVAAQSADGRAIVSAVGFRYTNGEEDVLTVTVVDGRRTCVGYRSDSTSCGLDSRSSHMSGAQAAAAIGGPILLCALLCPAGGGNSGGGQQPDNRNCSPAYTTGPNGEPQWYYPCGQ